MTLEQFERLPDDEMKHELYEGELVTIPPAKSLHNNVATRIVRALQKVEQRAGGEARAEAGFLLPTNPTTIRQPDVALVSTEQIAGSSQDEYFHGARLWRWKWFRLTVTSANWIGK